MTAPRGPVRRRLLHPGEVTNKLRDQIPKGYTGQVNTLANINKINAYNRVVLTEVENTEVIQGLGPDNNPWPQPNIDGIGFS